MLIRNSIAGLALVVLMAATGCAGVAAVLLVDELLDNEAPERTWSGTVTDQNGDPVGGLLVQVRAEIEGDSNLLHYSDHTDYIGEYSTTYRWHKDVRYSVRVVFDGVEYGLQSFGRIEKGDKTTDFVIDTRTASIVAVW